MLQLHSMSLDVLQDESKEAQAHYDSWKKQGSHEAATVSNFVKEQGTTADDKILKVALYLTK